MKTLKFNFSHPFKRRAIIKMSGTGNFPAEHLLLNSKRSNLIKIRLFGYKRCEYEVTLDCEVDKRFFVHQQRFEIKGHPNFIPVTV